MGKKSKRKQQENLNIKSRIGVREGTGGSYQTIHTIAFWGLAILLFFPPFFRGLFFAQEQEKALILAVVIFWLAWLWKWARKDSKFLSHPLDYFMLAFPAIYIISAFNAVNYGLAIDEIVKVILYFLTYWCVVQLVRSRRDAISLLNVVYASAVGVALAGLMTSTGLINIKDGFVGGRIYSSLQYPDALAGYLVAILVLGQYLWWRYTHSVKEQESQKGKMNAGRYIPYLFVIGNFLLAAVMIGAKSTGGFIVFGLVTLLLLLFLPGWNRLFVFIHLISVTIPAAACMHFFIKDAVSKHYAQAWLSLLPGLVLVILLQWLYMRLKPVISIGQINRRRLLMTGLAVVILLAVVAAFAGAGKISTVTEHFKNNTLMQRVIFIGDALNMLKDRPLLGWGGGGWQEAYRAFQSFSYTSAQVHSYYVQVGVETGIIGLLILAGIWLSFLYAGYRANKKLSDVKDKVFLLFLMVAAVAFCGHAAADFDLSLSALTLVLYTLAGLVRNMDVKAAAQEVAQSGKNKSFSIVPISLAGISGLAVLILTVSLIFAQYYANNAAALIQQRNLQGAIQSMESAIADNPFRADYCITLSDLYRYAGQKDKALAEANAALAKSKYSIDPLTNLASLEVEYGDNKEAIKYSEASIKAAPLTIEQYELAGTVYKNAGIAELKKGNKQLAAEYFSDIMKLPERITGKRNSLEPFRKANSYKLVLTPKIYLSMGISQYFTGNLNEANKYLRSALGDKNIQGEAYMWLSFLSEKQGNAKNAKTFLDKSKQISPEYEKIYNEIKSLPQID